MKRSKLLRKSGTTTLLIFLSSQIGMACSTSPGPLTLSVSGAQAGDKDYYGVEIPNSGTKIVKISGNGDTPCPVDPADYCTCTYNGNAYPPISVIAGNPIYHYNFSRGWQSVITGGMNGQTITMHIGSQTAPGEYQVQLSGLEQDYKACTNGYTGGVLSKTNTQASDLITIIVYKMDHTTTARVPSDRNRLKLGVGENVTLTFKPDSVSPSWSTYPPAASVNPSTGNMVEYTAPDTATTSLVSGSFHGLTRRISFEVLSPNSYWVQGFEHHETTVGTLVCDTRAHWYIGPTNVNFQNVRIAEGWTTAKTMGFFDYQDGLPHDPGSAEPSVTGTLVRGKGWLVQGADHVAGSARPHPNFRKGTFDWYIPWSYIANGNRHLFAEVDHHKDIVFEDGHRAVFQLKKDHDRDSAEEAVAPDSRADSPHSDSGAAEEDSSSAQLDDPEPAGSAQTGSANPPPSKPSASADPNIQEPDGLAQLKDDAKNAMSIVCEPADVGWNQKKLKAFGSLIHTLTETAQWLQRAPAVPDELATWPTPPEDLDTGVDPSAVKDPVARKAYSDALTRMRLMSKIRNDRTEVEQLYARLLNYISVFEVEYFNASDLPPVKIAIDNALKTKDLGENTKADLKALVGQLNGMNNR